MNITTERMPESQVLLTIEVDPERVEKSMEQAYRRVLPRVRVPGFRPGKAPRRVLERHVGRETLLQEALDRLVPEVVSEAIKEQELDAIDQPDLEISSIEPVVIKVTVPIRPTIDLGDYRELRLEPEPVEVDEAQIDQAIEDLRRRYATIEPVERPAQEGDRVRVSLTATAEGRQIVSEEDTELTVTPDALESMPGLYDQLRGMSKGEPAKFEAVLPEDYRRADLAGKPIHYDLTVLDVMEEVLPEPNAEFAQGVGEGFETMDALRERLQSDQRARAEEEAKRKLQEQAVEKLAEGATIEYPPQLVDHEVDHMLQEITQPAGNDRRALERVLAQAGRTPDDLKAELRPSAAERVKRTLVLSKLAEQEGIEVADADVDQELTTIAGTGPQAAQIRQIFDTPTGREMIERQLRSRRTLDRLTDIVRGQAPVLEQVPEGEISQPEAEPSAAPTAEATAVAAPEPEGAITQPDENVNDSAESVPEGVPEARSEADNQDEDTAG